MGNIGQHVAKATSVKQNAVLKGQTFLKPHLWWEELSKEYKKTSNHPQLS